MIRLLCVLALCAPALAGEYKVKKSYSVQKAIISKEMPKDCICVDCTCDPCKCRKYGWLNPRSGKHPTAWFYSSPNCIHCVRQTADSKTAACKVKFVDCGYDDLPDWVVKQHPEFAALRPVTIWKDTNGKLHAIAGYGGLDWLHQQMHLTPRATAKAPPRLNQMSCPTCPR